MHRNDRIMLFLGIILVIIALAGAAVSGVPKLDSDGGDDGMDYHDWPIRSISPKKIIGERLNENSDITLNITDINETYLVNVYFELHWEDEDNVKDAGVYKVKNKPDYFNYTVISPWMQVYISDTIPSSDGTGVIHMDIPVPEDEGIIGEWLVTIHCGDCGDQVLYGEVAGELLTVEEDTGNNWELTYYYEFHTNN